MVLWTFVKWVFNCCLVLKFFSQISHMCSIILLQIIQKCQFLLSQKSFGILKKFQMIRNYFFLLFFFRVNTIGVSQKITKIQELVQFVWESQLWLNYAWVQSQVNRFIKIKTNYVNKQLTLIYFYLLFLYSVLCRLWCSRLLFCSMWSHGLRQNRQILVRSANSLWNLRVPVNVPFLCCSLIRNTGLC